MIDRTCISETFGDCTALYNVYFDKHCTVEEFIHEVLKNTKTNGVILLYLRYQIQISFTAAVIAIFVNIIMEK